MPVELPVRDELSAEDIMPSTGSTGLSVIDSLPLSLVLLLASPYLAGQTAREAISVAHRLFHDHRFCSTLDILGEDSKSEEDCQRAIKEYKNLIDCVTASPIPASKEIQKMSISLKPSTFSVSIPPANGGSSIQLDDAYARIQSVVDYAAQRQMRVTIEAEDHHWTDFQLETYFALVNAGYKNVGTVLQSRLFRTRNDVRRFSESTRVRLVIGIYNEPAEIAHTEKSIMKELLVEYADELFARGSYVELATHDAECLKHFFQTVVIPRKVPTNQFETQYLLGVPRQKLQQALVSGVYFEGLKKESTEADRPYADSLAASGTLVRLYLPYGKDKTAAAYCRRRLKANPDMIGFGIRNLLHIQ